MLVETLQQLSNAFGVAGFEDEVRNLLQQLLKPYVDEISVDRLGNLIAVKRGKSDTPRVMLAAHMDEVGLMVKVIDEKGFIGFAKLGGIDDRILLAQPVIIRTEKGPVCGIIGSKPPHILKEEERKRVLEYTEMFIDVGASNREEVEKLGVRVGDPIVFDIQFHHLSKGTVYGKAFDDRAGCAALVGIAKALAEEPPPCTVYLVGTVQEEVGLRGAATSAYRLYPDAAIAIDVTVAGDVPGVKEIEAPIKLRKGPAITVADAGLIAHPKIFRLLRDTARELQIPFQLESGLGGTTDAARFALTREGIPSGVISIPTRYIHSPASLLSLSDLEHTVHLAVEAIRRLPRYL